MNLLHSLYDMHAANQKNGESMHLMRKMQGMSGNLRLNMDRGSITNPKSSQYLKGGRILHFHERITTLYGEIIAKFQCEEGKT